MLHLPASRYLLAAASLLLASAIAGAQTTRYVDDDALGDPGPGNPGVSDPLEDGSAAHPFDAIQEAIDAAVTGDTVLVREGTYTGAGNHDMDFGGKRITVRSLAGPETCIIDCQNAGRAFFFQSGETHAAVVDGFTITNGNAGGGNGGGIDCTLESAPTIRNCVLLNNAAAALGAGIACRGVSSAIITRCTFIGNISEGQGGGLSLFLLSDAIVTDCVFIDNSAQWGGAIDCSGSSPPITNCLCVGNTATLGGGGVYCSGADPTITNCTFTGNASANGGALVLAGLVLESYPVLTNCILWNDGPEEIVVGIGEPTITYSCVQGGWTGVGNIDADPIFLGETLNGEADYSLHATSPCIDAGDNGAVPGDAADLDGDGNTAEVTPLDLEERLRFADRLSTPDTGSGTAPLVDMGAYEYQCVGDLDGNGEVTLADLALLLANYGTTDGASYQDGDVNVDGDVDLSDLANLLANYGIECD